MRLIRYARGQEWTVYLYCEAEDTCQILDLLSTCGQIGERMLSDLEKVANRNLQSLQRDREFSKPIEGTKLLEFRLPTSKGPTPRVAYFFDRDHVIVCALALLKKTDRLPQDFIDKAQAIQKAYVDAGGCKAADIETFDDDNQ